MGGKRHIQNANALVGRAIHMNAALAVSHKISGIDFNDLSARQHFGDIYEQILTDLQSAGNAGEYYTPRAVTAFMVDRIDPHPGETLFDPACGTGGFLTCALRHMREKYVKKPQQEQAMQAALRAVDGRNRSAAHARGRRGASRSPPAEGCRTR